MGIAELRRLKVLESENRKLKQLMPDLSLVKAILQDILQKKRLKPVWKREQVD